MAASNTHQDSWIKVRARVMAFLLTPINDFGGIRFL